MCQFSAALRSFGSSAHCVRAARASGCRPHPCHVCWPTPLYAAVLRAPPQRIARPCTPHTALCRCAVNPPLASAAAALQATLIGTSMVTTYLVCWRHRFCQVAGYEARHGGEAHAHGRHSHGVLKPEVHLGCVGRGMAT